jgi:PAS domain S-box-containing protein
MRGESGTGTREFEDSTSILGLPPTIPPIVDSIAEHIVLHDSELHILWANKAAGDSVNLASEDLVGSHCYEVWHGRSEPCPLCPVRQALKTGEAHSAEISSPDGRAWHIKGYPLRNAEGEVTGAVEITSDITGRKGAEEEMLSSEEKYRNLIEGSLQGIFLIQDGRIIFANPAVAEFTGYSLEELTSMEAGEIHDLVHPDDRETTWGRYKDRLSGHNAEPRYEFRIIRKDGSECWLEMHASRISYQGRPAIQGLVLDVTESHKAEEALRASEEQHRALIENLNEIIFTLDKLGRFTYISPVIERVLGYRPQDILGQPFNCFVHPDDAAGLLVTFERSLSGEMKPHEFRVLAQDGSTRHARVSCRPQYTSGGAEGLTGVMADITQTKMADAMVKETEELYKALVTTTVDAVTVTDLQGNVTEVSERTLELHGFKRREDLVGRSCFELIAPEEHGRAIANMKKTLKEGTVRNLEYTFLRKDGSRFYAEMDAALVKDAEGNPRGFIATTRDITERKRAEKALRTSERRFRDIAENALEWIWEVDADGILTYSSPVVRKILGFSQNEVLGRPFYDLIPEEEREQTKEAAFRVFATRRPFRHIIKRNVHKDGSVVWLRSSGVPIIGDQGEFLGYRGADIDITERRLAERQLLHERQTLIQAFTAIETGVVVTDAQGCIVIFNPVAAQLTGFSEEKAVGRTIEEVVRISRPDGSGDVEAVREMSATTAVLVNGEGRSPTVRMAAVNIPSESGEPAGMVVMFSAET